MSPDAGQSARGHLLCRYSMLKNGRNLPECVQIIHKGVIMSGTIFSLIPPIVAIALALITKEVYLSLLIGIMSGAFLFTGPNPLHAVETMIAIMGEKIGGNVNILLFLAFLGIVVALITKSGASKAYGEWASHAIRTKKGALFATMFLGMLIFVDDYFNCLTVGTVMRPVTDKHKITRAKLATSSMRRRRRSVSSRRSQAGRQRSVLRFRKTAGWMASACSFTRFRLICMRFSRSASCSFW